MAALAGVLLVLMARLACADMRSLARMNGYIKTLYEDCTIPLLQLSEIMDLPGDAREDLRSVATTSVAAELTALERADAARDQKVDPIWDA